MLDAEVNIMKRWSEPQLAQTALHERILGGAQIDHGNRRLIVAGDEKSLMLQCCGAELYRDNNSEVSEQRCETRRGGQNPGTWLRRESDKRPWWNENQRSTSRQAW